MGEWTERGARRRLSRLTQLRIAIDATYSVGSHLSGIGVYANELLDGLAAAHPESEFLFCYRPHRFLRSLTRPLRSNCHRRLLRDDKPPLPNGVFHGLNQRMPRARCRHTVCTFHDLFVLTGEYSTREFRERFAAQARQAAERTDMVIAVSRFTASQVTNLLGVEPSRIRVVPHGVHLAPASPGARKERIVLHAGAIQQRKNVGRLVEAFERCPAGWRLVLAGSAGYGAAAILDRIQSSPRRADIQLTGYVPANELADLYNRAAILAFPSLDEGFGMPVLEAMARGVAVLTSHRSALPEVAGDAALLIDPFDTDSIAGGLLQLMRDEALRRRLADKGYQRAQLFPWGLAVERTWTAYRELTG